MIQALGHQKLSNHFCNSLKESFRREEIHQRSWIEKGEDNNRSLSPPKTCRNFGSSTCSSSKSKTRSSTKKHNISSFDNSLLSSKKSIVSTASKSSTWNKTITDLVDTAEIGWGVKKPDNEEEEFSLDLGQLTSKYNKRSIIQSEFYDNSHFEGFLTHRRAPPSLCTSLKSNNPSRNHNKKKKRKDLIFD